MSKSRQSKIEEIRQQSVEALREARIQALHAKDKNTPLVSEAEKQTMPPPPPPGAAGASSGGGGVVDTLNCILPGQCRDTGLIYHQKSNSKLTRLDFIDIPAYHPTKSSLDDISPVQGEYREYWAEKNDEYVTGEDNWFKQKYTGLNVIPEEPGIPTALDKGGQGQTGIGKIGGFNAIPWCLGPSLKLWGYNFEFKFFNDVTAVGELPASGSTGDVCFVDTEGAYFLYSSEADEPGWSPGGEGGGDVPNSVSGSPVGLAQVWADWNSVYQEHQKRLQELNNTNPSAIWAAYYLPKYMLFKAGFTYGNEEVE